jgi:hypothetical protein
LKIELTEYSETSALKLRRQGITQKLQYNVVVTKPIFIGILLAQQLHVKKLCAESNEYAADLTLTLGHEQMGRLVDRHDIHTKCSFYYPQNAYQ